MPTVDECRNPDKLKPKRKAGVEEGRGGGMRKEGDRKAEWATGRIGGRRRGGGEKERGERMEGKCIRSKHIGFFMCPSWNWFVL